VRLFLKLNGMDIQASKEETIRIMLDLASGKIDGEGMASWLRQHSS